MKSGVATPSKGSGHDENTIASTISAIFTIPITRLISTSFDRTGPSRNAAAKLAPGPRSRSIATGGPTHSPHPTPPHKENTPGVVRIEGALKSPGLAPPPAAIGP